jgi:hypothetical protein
VRCHVAAAVAVAALAAPTTAALAAAGDEVTIRVREYFQQGSMSRQVEVTGTVPSREAGELVEVLIKECGPSHTGYRVVAGTRTLAGGSWRIATNEPSTYGAVNFPINAYYRARWQGRLSAVVLNQVAVPVLVNWRPRLRRVDITVATGQTGQNLRGRQVELQRRVAGTDAWVRVRRARLVRAVRYGEFRTRFAVPTRGLTLRVLVPTETGAPCFQASASQTWRS